MAIRDEVWVRAAPSRVFTALTKSSERSRWWPQRAESVPEVGGALTLYWFGGGMIQTKFHTMLKDREISYAFYSEHLTFRMKSHQAGAKLEILHECSADAAVHVAQCRGFLKANLKAYLEHGVDLKDGG